MKTTILLAAAALLSACAGSPIAISNAKPEELKQYNNAQLCSAYYHAGPSASFKAEIDSRRFITPEHWQKINERKVSVGMPEAAVICAWGTPTDVNRSVSAYGERKQMVYKHGPASRQYVYTVNGVVESISTH